MLRYHYPEIKKILNDDKKLSQIGQDRIAGETFLPYFLRILLFSVVLNF